MQKKKNKITDDPISAKKKSFCVPNLLHLSNYPPDLYNHNLSTLPTKEESMRMLAVAFDNGLPILLNNVPHITSFFSLETFYKSFFDDAFSDIFPSTVSSIAGFSTLNGIYFSKETVNNIEKEIPISLGSLINILCFLETFVIDSFSWKTQTSADMYGTVNLLVTIKLKTSETLYAKVIFNYSSYSDENAYQHWHWSQPSSFFDIDYVSL